MKILVIHNSHRSRSSSGDDVVFEREARFLKGRGNEVIQFNPKNDEFDEGGLLKKLITALQIPWSFSSSRRIREIVRKEKPDIAHVHNFFPLISPSVYHILKAEGVPVVQTLHDFRFFCAMAFFMRGGRICEECKEGAAFRSIRYGCFKHSRIGTIPPAVMLKLHQYLDTFREKIDVYICLTEFQKKIFARAGFDEDKLFVKPNFVDDVSIGNEEKKGNYVAFIGRLGKEKGIKTLIEAWSALPEVPLIILGDGPDAQACKTLVRSLEIKNVEFLGFVPHEECMKVLDDARFLVVPSICYETFGLTIVEAFSHAKPVIASNLGAMADIVADGVTGLFFEPGKATDLAKKVRMLWTNLQGCIAMGRNARKEYETNYTPERSYQVLTAIYESVVKQEKLP